MTCGDWKRHAPDNTRLGRELGELAATNADVDRAARKYDETVERLRELPLRTIGNEPEVEQCPAHEWRAEDRRPRGGGSQDLAAKGWYEMYVCRLCRAPQCDSGAFGYRCLEARHHQPKPHRIATGVTWPVGGNP